MLNRFKLLPAALLILSALTACTEKTILENWYLIGDDITLSINLKKGSLTLKEENSIIFDATIREYEFSEKNKLRVNAVMKEIGDKKEYKLKFENIKEFILWFEIEKNSLKMIFNKFHNKPYYFYSQPSSLSYVKYRMLSPFENESFRNSANFRDARKDYNLDIIVNKVPMMTAEQVIQYEKRADRQWQRKENSDRDIVIRSMLDYMLDMDNTTYWATEDYWGTEMEFFIKDNSGRNLNKPIKIRGFYFNTGNRYKPADYFNMHRMKDLGIAFSKNYEGSLGVSKANYNYINYKITLPDNQEEKILVFLQPIEANSIRIKYHDFYLGTTDAFAIFDFTVFVDND